MLEMFVCIASQVKEIFLCEILIAEAQNVLLIIISIHHRIQLTRSVDETSFEVAYANVCGK